MFSVKAAYTFICDSTDIHAYVGKSPMSAIFMRKDDLCSIVLKWRSINGPQDSSKNTFYYVPALYIAYVLSQENFIKDMGREKLNTPVGGNLIFCL